MKLVLACATVGAAQAFVTPTAFTGTSLSAARTSTGSTRMSLAGYKEELAETAKKIAGPGEPSPPVMWRWAPCACHRPFELSGRGIM